MQCDYYVRVENADGDLERARCENEASQLLSIKDKAGYNDEHYCDLCVEQVRATVENDVEMTIHVDEALREAELVA